VATELHLDDDTGGLSAHRIVADVTLILYAQLFNSLLTVTYNSNPDCATWDEAYTYIDWEKGYVALKQ
jgi:hypothetical protein